MEDEKILILHQKPGSDSMKVKIRQKVKKGYSPDSYFKTLNPQDPNDLALLFEDLEMVMNAPVERAIKKFRENKQKGWPFF
jgi:DNA-binding protein Fis